MVHLFTKKFSIIREQSGQHNRSASEECDETWEFMILMSDLTKLAYGTRLEFEVEKVFRL